MKIEEFDEVLMDSLNIIELGKQEGYFREEDSEELYNQLNKILRNGVVKEIEGTAIYGAYVLEEQRLHYNAKVFKNKQEALIYVLHEMKHGLDDKGNSMGFESKVDRKGVGINEGATQRFATDIAEEFLGEKIPYTEQTSLGIMLNTNLDEYQIEDKMNELLCKALGISKAEFFKMQNQPDGKGLAQLKEMFDKHADFDEFQKALDGIYLIQEETWVDENGNLLEKEAEPTKEQTQRAKDLIKKCQEQIIQYIEKSQPERIEEIKENMIMIDGEIMNNLEMLYEDDYLKYQEFITRNLDLGDSKIVFVSGLGGFPFEPLHNGDTGTCIRELLDNSDKPFTETVYIRKNETYQKIDVIFGSNGVITSSEPQIIESFDDIIEGLEHSEIIGNAEEYIKILQLRGEKEKADLIRRKYEYFMNNKDRIPEIKEEMAKPNRSPDRIQLDKIREMLLSGITWENEQDSQIGEEDFAEVASNSIEVSGEVSEELGRASKENEGKKYIGE